jgi:GT2 family glycosyltransferase
MSSDAHQSSSHSHKKAVVIVLVYNGMRWLDACLGSLLKTRYPNLEIVAVDNVSKDQSVEYIRQYFPQVSVIQNRRNQGTAEGNNVGMRYALNRGAQYIALLNQDTKVDPQWLASLIALCEKNPSLGLVSSMQMNYEGTDIDANVKKALDRTTYDADAAQGKLQEYYEVSSIIGACMVFKREVLLRVGLFDPDYFMYTEETDLCRRAIYHGYKIGYATNSQIYHHHSLVHWESMPEKLKILCRKNHILFTLKAPEHSFFYNMKAAFRWINWGHLFGITRLTRLQIMLLFMKFVVSLPYIYDKYRNEKMKACYLS